MPYSRGPLPGISSGDDFICELDEEYGSACDGLPFYAEHKGKRYCVLHFPGEDKRDDFQEVLKRKLEQRDYDFSGAVFPEDTRMWQTFNPVYWLETLIFLPREALGYLGVPAESVFVKLCQFVWWLTVFALTTLVALYRPEIKSFVEGWL